MAAGSLPAPGTRYGPCFDPCQHRDCAASRATAASICSFCDEPIGYEAMHYRGEDGQSKWVHAICLETFVERTTLTS